MFGTFTEFRTVIQFEDFLENVSGEVKKLTEFWNLLTPHPSTQQHALWRPLPDILPSANLWHGGNKHLYWFGLCEFNNSWNHVLSLSSLPSTSHLPNHLILINSLSYIHPIFLHSLVLITGALPKGWQGASTPERFQKREKLENMVYFHAKKKSIKLAFLSSLTRTCTVRASITIALNNH